MDIALVGLGGMGAVHYHNYLHMDEARVVALVGMGEADERRAAEWGLPLYPTVTELLARHEVQLVDICAPTFLHKALALESLGHGKHTLTEKPAALSLSDAREMYEAAEKNGAQLYVAHVLQFSREVEVLREVTEKRLYGEPLDASFIRLSARPRWSHGSWLMKKEKSGLLPYDLHIHDLDVIISLFGEPKDIRYTTCGGSDKAYHEQYRFTYGFDKLHVSAEAAWLNADIPFTARWRVYYENGALWYDGERVTGYQRGKEPVVFDTEEAIKISTGINLPPTGWFLKELTHFVRCAEKNRPSERVPKERVLSVMKVLETIVREEP